MSAGTEVWSTKDWELVELVDRARTEGPDGEAAYRLCSSVLPGLLGGLARSFPDDIRDQAVSYGWENLCSQGFRSAKRPCAWLRERVRRDLLSVVIAERHGVPVAVVRDPYWGVLKEELGLGEGYLLMSRQGEPELWEQVSGPGLGVDVFTELATLLIEAGWPISVVCDAVGVLEERADRGCFSEREILKDLKGFPTGALKEALVRFVKDPEGYVVGRLQGRPAGELLERATVQAGLAGLGMRAAA